MLNANNNQFKLANRKQATGDSFKKLLVDYLADNYGRMIKNYLAAMPSTTKNLIVSFKDNRLHLGNNGKYKELIVKIPLSEMPLSEMIMPNDKLVRRILQTYIDNICQFQWKISRLLKYYTKSDKLEQSYWNYLYAQVIETNGNLPSKGRRDEFILFVLTNWDLYVPFTEQQIKNILKTLENQTSNPLARTLLMKLFPFITNQELVVAYLPCVDYLVEMPIKYLTTIYYEKIEYLKSSFTNRKNCSLISRHAQVAWQVNDEHDVDFLIDFLLSNLSNGDLYLLDDFKQGISTFVFNKGSRLYCLAKIDMLRQFAYLKSITDVITYLKLFLK